MKAEALLRWGVPTLLPFVLRGRGGRTSQAASEGVGEKLGGVVFTNASGAMKL